MSTKRGIANPWDAIKWFPRIVLIALVVVLFSMIINSLFDITYDQRTVDSHAFHTRILYSDVFSPEDAGIDYSGAGRIALASFTSERLETRFFLKRAPVDDSGGDVEIVELHTAPIAARLDLAPVVPGAFEERTIHYREDDYLFYRDIALEPGRSSVYLTESRTAVSVLVEHENGFEIQPGILTIRVIAV